jgi:hypothetical protein
MYLSDKSLLPAGSFWYHFPKHVRNREPLLSYDHGKEHQTKGWSISSSLSAHNRYTKQIQTNTDKIYTDTDMINTDTYRYHLFYLLQILKDTYHKHTDTDMYVSVCSCIYLYVSVSICMYHVCICAAKFARRLVKDRYIQIQTNTYIYRQDTEMGYRQIHINTCR